MAAVITPRELKNTDVKNGPHADPIGVMEDEGGGVVTPAQANADEAESMHSTTQPNQGKLEPRTESDCGCG